MRDARVWVLNQPRDVADDVLQSEGRDLALALQVGQDIGSPVPARDVRQIVFVSQQVIDDQHPGRLDGLLDRLVATERLLIKREGQRFRDFVQRIVGGLRVLNFLAHSCGGRIRINLA